ncbi:class E sortase [Nonomuraea roseoviolacea]|uniref:Sortase A n=1 Tax=Nonomuraea roseoviolacea subsp. carminata TaxID=160689 RepID=A0ABT1K0S5_9ACTN|nr:class E sortase [Nonomuraea roseoviolacea]MCP2347229.1 sortase A [Nonomuraea roseoviolacea subsp. carminata]
MRATLRAAGDLCITAGLVLLLFCAYLLWGTGAYTDREQPLLEQELAREQADPGPQGDDGPKRLKKIKLGQAVALLRIPRLGNDYKYAVIEGVTTEHLRKGPGHYPGTAMPGQKGNFVVSGHRTTYGAPFNEIDELKKGDEIVVDAREARYTYRVTYHEVVLPTDLDVIAPVPGKPDRKPSKAFITLTTCHPEYSAAQRYIVHGVLDRVELRKV